MLNHNPYDDFEAPPINLPERFFFDWAFEQLEGAFEQQQQRDSAAEKVAPSERVTEVEGNEESCEHSARCVTISHLDLLLLTCHQLP